MPQGDYIELHQKRFGHRPDHWEVKRKKEARIHKNRSKMARTLTGIKAKLFNKKRYTEKAQMKKMYLSFVSHVLLVYMFPYILNLILLI